MAKKSRSPSGPRQWSIYLTQVFAGKAKEPTEHPPTHVLCEEAKGRRGNPLPCRQGAAIRRADQSPAPAGANPSPGEKVPPKGAEEECGRKATMRNTQRPPPGYRQLRRAGLAPAEGVRPLSGRFPDMMLQFICSGRLPRRPRFSARADYTGGRAVLRAGPYIILVTLPPRGSNTQNRPKPCARRRKPFSRGEGAPEGGGRGMRAESYRYGTPKDLRQGIDNSVGRELAPAEPLRPLNCWFHDAALRFPCRGRLPRRPRFPPGQIIRGGRAVLRAGPCIIVVTLSS